ncbi:xylulokinase [Rhodovulum euryhalinum]|uniref:Xylulose kinase n=1 Tax=Rhodovulum euryhalinum TaxID=35805 RepID=A0A4R2KRR8_9RHOB|nr:xylulokinase [Rhodovulum euryhalinum]TCO72828.1 xylulokinase [Rhodovulum euryhalinum]
MLYLGLDLGTSALKALVIDEAQSVVASAEAAITAHHPRPGWSEQDPADWIAAAETVMQALRAGLGERMAAIRGIGLSGQMHGATMLGADDRVLAPCILWNDTRSAAQAARLDADPDFRAISGSIVFPGFTAPKLVWLRETDPALFGQVAKVLLPKDFLRLWLAGEHVSEMSDAAGTSWLDTGARDWSDRLLAATGMERAQMPRLVEGSAPSGGLRADLARRWGMRADTVVAGGAGDNAASAVGLGTVGRGDGFVSLGTSGVLFAACDAYSPRPETAVHTFCHALPGMWHQMGVMLSAASALAWFAGIAGAAPAALIAELDQTDAGPSPVSFLPYLSGERTPHNDPGLRAGFHGLSAGTTRAEMTRAVLDGVAFALRENLMALAAAGTRPARLMAVGGGSRSDLWLGIIATVLGLQVDRPAAGERGAAFGAARLGLMAAEGADPAAICTAPPVARSFAPDPDHAASHDAAFARFRALREAVSARRG